MIDLYSKLTEREEYNNVREISNVIKWGQLKLFLSEVQFLNKIIKETKSDFTVLYIGAADGYHIGKLAELFPQFMFHLWDPRDFAVKESKNIKIFQKFFTDDEAEIYSKNGNSTLIICDIRTVSIKFAKEEKDIKRRIKKMDEIIENDLEFQKKWVELIKPYASLLKFRLPYGVGTTKYFDGIIYLQQFGPLSTEARLLVKNTTEFKLYDNIEYDEKMVYFNTHIRPLKVNKYESLLEKLNLKNNLDNAMMIKILKEYLIVNNKNSSEDNIIKFVTDVLNYHRKFNNKYYKGMIINTDKV
jgi:hypothetical protein